MIRRQHKGQGTLEYILLVTAVLVVLIALLGSGGIFGQKLNSTLEQPLNAMDKYSNKIANKWGL